VQAILERAQLPRLHAERKALYGERWRAVGRDLWQRLGSGFLVGLVGPRGTGKTQMGVRLIQGEAQRLVTARYTHVLDAVSELSRPERFDGPTPEERRRAYAGPRVLVVDEVSNVFLRDRDLPLFIRLVDGRYAERLDTLLLSNENPDAFDALVGPSLVSRMKERGGLITCDWPSYRDQPAATVRPMGNEDRA